MQAGKHVYLDIELAYSQIGDAEVMTDMLQLLQEALERDLPLIAQLLQAGDVASANRLLHSLKGFMPIFCDAALCNEIAQVEAQSKDVHSLTVGPAYAQVRPKLQVLLAEVGSHLMQPSQAGQ